MRIYTHIRFKNDTFRGTALRATFKSSVLLRITLFRRILVWRLALLGLVGLTAPHCSGEEFPPAPEGTFSIAVIPDTQHYRGRDSKAEPDSDDAVTNRVFDAYTTWVADHLQEQRIEFVTHVGDIVDINRRDQWEVAQHAMERLHDRVPYGISVGNHDMERLGDSSLFQEFFGTSRFASFDWYGGCFHPQASGDGNSAERERESVVSVNNANSFQLFSTGGMDFIVLHLECNAPDDVLDWANSKLEEHADRRALVTTHMYLGPRDRPKTSQDFFDAPKGRMRWTKCHGSRGNSAQQMWDKCFRKHANLFLICCGDQSRTQAWRQTVRGDAGNVVHELLSDYGASGLRVMRFLPDKNRIEVRTWNPMTESFCQGTSIVPDVAQHQFDLEYEMSAEQ